MSGPTRRPSGIHSKPCRRLYAVMDLKFESSNKEQQKTAKPRGSILWREPLIHFFVLGLVVFGLHGILEKKPETVDDPFLVEVTSADIEWYRTMWNKRMGREPTVEELRGQVNQSIREQVLSREAVAIGLDEGDPVLRRRLAQKMDFLFKDLSEITEPSDDELKIYFQNNLDTYEIPGKVSFIQIYFNTDKREVEEAAEEIRLLVEKLNASDGIPRDVSALGDRSLLQADFSNRTLKEIKVEFGPNFANEVWSQPFREWQGPIPSGYGFHAVYIYERVDKILPEFKDLQERIRADWLADKQRDLARKAYDELRRRYRVLVEGMPYNLDVSG